MTCNDDTSRWAANFRNDRSAARRALRLPMLQRPPLSGAGANPAQ